MPISDVQHKLRESLREMAVWEKHLKSKDEKQNLRALIYLADFQDKRVPLRIEIEFRGEAPKASLKLYRKAMKGDAAEIGELAKKK